MNKKIVLVDLKKLRSHEEIDPQHLEEIYMRIENDGFLKNPVVVERQNFVILDGHHRVAAFKKMKLKSIPAYMISYSQARVFLRRKLDIKDIKREVVKRGISKKLFPSKTTRHLIKNRPRNINISLNSLL